MYRKNTQSFDITRTCLKRNVTSTHPDVLRVDTCDQKRHTRHPVKLSYLQGRRERVQRTDASVVDNALKLQGIVHNGGTRHHLRSEETHKKLSKRSPTDCPSSWHRGSRWRISCQSSNSAVGVRKLAEDPPFAPTVPVTWTLRLVEGASEVFQDVVPSEAEALSRHKVFVLCNMDMLQRTNCNTGTNIGCLVDIVHNGGRKCQLRSEETHKKFSEKERTLPRTGATKRCCLNPKNVPWQILM